MVKEERGEGGRKGGGEQRGERERERRKRREGDEEACVGKKEG